MTIAGVGKPSVLQLRGVTGVVTRAVFENVMIRNDPEDRNPRERGRGSSW